MSETPHAPGEPSEPSEPSKPVNITGGGRKPRKSPIATSELEKTRFNRAVGRWGAVLGVLAVFALLYFKHNYYQSGQFIPWRTVFPFLVAIWVLLGIPYTIAALRKFESRAFYSSESALHWMVIARVIWGKRKLHLWKHRRLKNTILASVVKGFFTPLMAGFLSGHLTNVGNAFAKKKGLEALKPLTTTLKSIGELGSYLAELKAYLVTGAHHVLASLPNGSDFAALFNGATYTLPNVRWGLDLAYDSVFIVDCGWAFFGYIAESRFLGNKTKSVEPTGIGWAAAIFCYPPFNGVLGTYAPFLGRNDHLAYFGSKKEVAELVFKGLIVLFFTVYASATVAFGAKFSNLTNRGVVQRGPYRFIRHPAYTCKCIAWWLEQIPTITPATALSLVVLCCWYGLRAFTEEKHLSQDPAYVAYKKKVKWAAIPGVF
jgi:hypothetical protein